MAFATCPGQPFLLGVRLGQRLATCTGGWRGGTGSSRQLWGRVGGRLPSASSYPSGVHWVMWALPVLPLPPAGPGAYPGNVCRLVELPLSVHFSIRPTQIAAPWGQVCFLFLSLLACHNRHLLHAYGGESCLRLVSLFVFSSLCNRCK